MTKTHNIDTELLDSFIKKSGLKISYIADRLNITVAALKAKRIGKTPFTVTEMYTLCDLLEISDDDMKRDIFSPKVKL